MNAFGLAWVFTGLVPKDVKPLSEPTDNPALWRIMLSRGQEKLMQKMY